MFAPTWWMIDLGRSCFEPTVRRLLQGKDFMSSKHVYSFGGKSADGDGKMKTLLGGKGANLAEMCKIGIPVPPGFTITTEVCAAYYDHGKKIPEDAIPQIDEALAKMEALAGKKFGDPSDPLLVSVRSGAALSMPGMMNTILNLGLTDASVAGLAKKTGNERFAYDSYRRVIDMFGSTAMGVEHEEFEHEISKLKSEKGVKLDTDLTVDDLKELVKRYKAVYKKHVGDDFPQDPKKQLMLDINADSLREGFWKHLPLAGLVGAVIALEMALVAPGGGRARADRTRLWRRDRPRSVP